MVGRASGRRNIASSLNRTYEFNCRRKDSLYDPPASRGKKIESPDEGESKEVIRIFAFFTVILVSTGASAASSVPWSQAPAIEPLVQQAQAYCIPRFAECRLRFGEGRDFRRCMRRAGCADYRGDRGGRDCGRVNRRCRDRFGGGPDYRRCMRRRDCAVRRGPDRDCRRANRVCRDRFGRGPDYRRCMRRRDCR